MSAPADAGVAAAAPNATRLPGLDGLRALSVLAVIGLHAWPGVLPGGGIGVSLFFVLSGFLITTLLDAERSASGRVALGRFYGRRALRLFPAFAVVLGAALLFSATLASPAVALHTRQGAVASLAYVASWGRAFDSTQSYGALGHTWSLSVEEQFYLLWPLLLVAALRWRTRSWALVMCLCTIVVIWTWQTALASGGAAPERIYFGADTRADCLVVGCAIALARSAGLLGRIPRTWFRAGAVLGFAYLAAFVPFFVAPTSLWSCWPVQAVVSGVVIAAVVEAPPAWLMRVLQLRPLVYLGAISYGVYLWHFLVWTALSAHLGAGPLALVLVTVPSIALAALSHRWVERPALRLKRRLATQPVRVAETAALRGAAAAA